MSIITLTNNNSDPGKINFRINAPNVFHLAKNIFIYDTKK